MAEALEAALIEETGAEPDAPLPRAIAAQLSSVQALVFTEIGRRTTAGQSPETIARANLDLLDTTERLPADRLLTYATREDRPCSG